MSEEEEEEKVEITPALVTTFVINGLIIIITLYLAFLYIKSKEFHSYSCGHILILSFLIFLDNAIRLIPISSKDKYKAFHYIQAFVLTALDKCILIVLVVQMFTVYMAIMMTEFYFNHKKAIFFSAFFGTMAISLLISGLYLLFGLDKYGIYYYVHGTETKQICDTIFNSIFLVFNTFFCGIIILNIALRKEQIEKDMANESALEHELIRMILMTIANTIMYIESFLIVWDKLPVPDEYIDLVYIITCLIINFIYAINSLVIQETKKIFCISLNSSRTKTYNYSSKLSQEISSTGDEN